MLPSYALLSLIFITLTGVDASPVSRGTGKGILSFATRINERGILNIVENDRARHERDNLLGKNSMLTLNAENVAFVYVAEVGVGSPETIYTLGIDTGSSNTWVGAIKPYVKTSTSQDTGHPFHKNYGTGSVIGEEWVDTVTLSPDLVIRQQPIGVADGSHGFSNSGLDGLLGLGPADLTNHTVDGMDAVPTVMDNLYSQGTIPQEVLEVYFAPFCKSNGGGELMFGGYDESAIISPVVYAPVTTMGRASHYWGIELSINYGADTILPSTTGIVDTGTSVILLANDTYRAIQSMTGAVYDSATHLLRINGDQYDRLQPLTFHIGGEPLVLTPNAQIFPRSLNTFIGGSPDEIYLVFSNLGAKYGNHLGFDFVLGYTFLQRYYSIYDTRHQKVGFAATANTYSECN